MDGALDAPRIRGREVTVGARRTGRSMHETQWEQRGPRVASLSDIHHAPKLEP